MSMHLKQVTAATALLKWDHDAIYTGHYNLFKVQGCVIILFKSVSRSKGVHELVQFGF